MKKVTKALRRVTNVISVYSLVMIGVSRFSKKREHEYDINGYHVDTIDHDMTGMNMLAETRMLVGNSVSIATDGLFELMPADVQKCIVAHELGHMVLEGGQPEDMAQYAAMRMSGVCPNAEKVADSMMTSIYGKKAAIKTLVALGIVSPGSIPELIQRIIAIVK